MDDETRRDMIVLGCAMGGIVLGMALRQKRRGEPVDLSAVVGGGMASIGAAAGIARRMSDVLGLDPSDQRPRALVAFSSAAALSFFADHIEDFVPGVELS